MELRPLLLFGLYEIALFIVAGRLVLLAWPANHTVRPSSLALWVLASKLYLGAMLAVLVLMFAPDRVERLSCSVGRARSCGHRAPPGRKRAIADSVAALAPRRMGDPRRNRGWRRSLHGGSCAAATRIRLAAKLQLADSLAGRRGVAVRVRVQLCQLLGGRIRSGAAPRSVPLPVCPGCPASRYCSICSRSTCSLLRRIFRGASACRSWQQRHFFPGIGDSRRACRRSRTTCSRTPASSWRSAYWSRD